jgi:gliding motility-associated-like protein
MIRKAIFLKYNLLIITLLTICNIANSQTIIIDPAGPFCTGEAPVSLTATPAGGTWSGAGIIDPAAGLFSPGDAGVGDHIITYDIGNDSETITIKVNATPVVEIKPAGPFCVRDEDYSLELITGPQGGLWSGNGIISSNTGLFSPSIAGTGTHVITYSTQGDCIGTDFIMIIVEEVDNISITPQSALCRNGAPVQLSAQPTGGYWEGNGVTPQGIFTPGLALIGKNEIKYIYELGNCKIEGVIIIDIIETVEAEIGNIGPFCSNDATVMLTANPFGGVWEGPGVDIDGTFNPKLAAIGENRLHYIITEGECTDTAKIDIEIFSGISAVQYDAKPVECHGDASSLDFIIVGGTKPILISWNDGAEINTIDTTFIKSIFAGSYYFNMIDANGCTYNTTQVNIKDSKNTCIEIPNTFTPNNDGYNDYWFIKSIDKFPEAEIYIYNQWGQVVFKSIGEYSPWNGNYLNTSKQLPVGQYIYTIDLKENTEILKGIVGIIR